MLVIGSLFVIRHQVNQKSPALHCVLESKSKLGSNMFVETFLSLSLERERVYQHIHFFGIKRFSPNFPSCSEKLNPSEDKTLETNVFLSIQQVCPHLCRRTCSSQHAKSRIRNEPHWVKACMGVVSSRFPSGMRLGLFCSRSPHTKASSIWLHAFLSEVTNIQKQQLGWPLSPDIAVPRLSATAASASAVK